MNKTDNKTPLVSIITVVYNAAQYLEDAIKSVLGQSYGNIEYIVVDGGSSDGSVDIIRRYENRIAYWVSEKDGGMYDALAKGLARARGELCAYINADDFYSPTAVEAAVRIFNENPEVNWFTGMDVTYSKEGFLVYATMPYRYRPRLIQAGAYGRQLPFIQQESTFWRGSLNQLIDLPKLAAFRLAGDYYLWKCFSSAGNILYVAGIYLGGLRKHGQQLSSDKALAGEESGRNRYLREMKTITEPLGFGDWLLTLWDRIVWRLPPRLKMKMSPYWIKYDFDKEKFD